MKNLVLMCTVALLSIFIAVPEAEAKRFGGGRSSGMSRQAAPQQPPKQPAASPQQTPGRQATPPGQTSRPGWLGPVAGLAAGLGLAALFSHLGLGEGFATFFMLILLAAAAFFVLRMLFRRNSPSQATGTQYAGATPYGSVTPPPAQPAPQQGGSTTSRADASSMQGFDAEGFIRQAKVNFIRLQAANDRGDLDDIRQFTTPEMFAEARLEIADRGTTPQQTDVVDLNAEVVEVTEEEGRYIVSVRFNGLIREENAAAPTEFDEIWHLTKPVNGTDGWRIAGIQQIG